jgi:hypothetical protein
MPLPKILHAINVFEERDFPYNTLHVVTNMPALASSPGFNAEDSHEMMQAIAPHIGMRCEFGRCRIHAPDQP